MSKCKEMQIKGRVCFDSGRYAQAVLTDTRLARSLGVNNTPTLFVNGQRIGNPLDYNEIRQVIESVVGTQ